MITNFDTHINLYNFRILNLDDVFYAVVDIVFFQYENFFLEDKKEKYEARYIKNKDEINCQMKLLFNTLDNYLLFNLRRYEEHIKHYDLTTIENFYKIKPKSSIIKNYNDYNFVIQEDINVFINNFKNIGEKDFIFKCCNK